MMMFDGLGFFLKKIVEKSFPNKTKSNSKIQLKLSKLTKIKTKQNEIKSKLKAIDYLILRAHHFQISFIIFKLSLNRRELFGCCWLLVVVVGCCEHLF